MAKPVETAQTGISSTAVRTAAVELEKMKGSLKSWLKYRLINDEVIAGAAKTKIPPKMAARVVMQTRDPAIEADLAAKLSALLGELYPGTVLPTSAVALAQIAVSGQPPGQMQKAAPMDGVMATHPWLLPVLIAGGLLLGVTTAIKTAADVAKEREHYACIQSGACTDYGFWLKAGGITVLAWFAWSQLGVGDMVKGAIKKRRS